MRETAAVWTVDAALSCSVCCRMRACVRARARARVCVCVCVCVCGDASFVSAVGSRAELRLVAATPGARVAGALRAAQVEQLAIQLLVFDLSEQRAAYRRYIWVLWALEILACGVHLQDSSRPIAYTYFACGSGFKS